MRQALSLLGILPVVLAHVALASGAATRAGAQAPTQRPLCWHGRPYERCASLVLFEVAYLWRLAGTETVRELPNDVPGRPGVGPEGTYRQRLRPLQKHASWEVGLMTNRRNGTAFGAALLVGTGDWGARFGAKLRGRYWLGDYTSVELAAGGVSVPMFVPVQPLPPPTESPTIGVRRVGGTADLRLNFADQIAAVGRVEAVPDGQGKLQTGFYAGASAGSSTAVVANLVTGAVMLWIAAAILGGT